MKTTWDAAGQRIASIDGNNKSTTYAVPDPFFSTYFASTKIYKFMEWTTTSPGGANNGAAGLPGAAGSAPGGESPNIDTSSGEEPDAGDCGKVLDVTRTGKKPRYRTPR